MTTDWQDMYDEAEAERDAFQVALQRVKEMIMNVVEDCYQIPQLHCTACARSLEMALRTIKSALGETDGTD